MTTQPHECGDDGKLKPAAQYICELAAWGQALEREVALLRTDYCTREERNYLQARVAELEGERKDAAAESVENYKRASHYREALERICDLVVDTNTLGDAVDIANAATATKD